MRVAPLVAAFLVFLAVASTGCTPDGNRQGESDAASGLSGPLTVFAAASFAEVTAAFVDSFVVRHPGVVPRVSVASSSVLARQIESGAPADVFLSADIRWIEHLDSLSRIDRAESPRFTNTLAVFVWPDQATYTTPSDLLRVSRIAVGDPDHVPAGRYARRALECLGLWEELEDQVVPAADARASLQMLLTGATPAAIGYTSDSRFVDDRIRVVAMPTECAPEIRYGLATVAGSAQPATANAFLSFILRDDQRSVWTSLGFVGAQ